MLTAFFVAPHSNTHGYTPSMMELGPVAPVLPWRAIAGLVQKLHNGPSVQLQTKPTIWGTIFASNNHVLASNQLRWGQTPWGHLTSCSDTMRWFMLKHAHSTCQASTMCTRMGNLRSWLSTLSTAWDLLLLHLLLYLDFCTSASLLQSSNDCCLLHGLSMFNDSSCLPCNDLVTLIIMGNLPRDCTH